MPVHAWINGTWSGRQTGAYAVGVALCSLLGLFPPLAEQRVSEGFPRLASQKGSRVTDSRFIGHGYLFTHVGEVKGEDGARTNLEWNIAWGVLLVEWLVVSLAAATAIWFLRRDRRSATGVVREGSPGFAIGSMLGSTLVSVGAILTVVGGAHLLGPLYSSYPPAACCCIVVGIPLCLLGAGIQSRLRY